MKLSIAILSICASAAYAQTKSIDITNIVQTPPPGTFSSICPLTDACAEKNGACWDVKSCERKYEELMLNNGGEGYTYAFEPSLCTASGADTTVRCGCCIIGKVTKPPSVEEPCKQTNECEDNNGKCVSYEMCKEHFPNGNFKWEPHFCHDDASTSSDQKCGCCIPDDIVTPPPSVNEPCKQTHECKKHNGKCVSYEVCKRNFHNIGFKWEPKLCNQLSTHADQRCGCCIPEDIVTPPPSVTQPCYQTPECKKNRGFCTDRERCRVMHPAGDFEWKPSLCKSKTNKDCGCCIRKQTPPPSISAPCKQTKMCRLAKGKCMSEAQCEKMGPKYEPVKKLCSRNPNIDCVCCVPRKQTPPPSIPAPCKQTKMCFRAKGKCMSEAQCEKMGPKFEPVKKLCSRNPSVDCVCCVPRKQTPPPTVEAPCKQNRRCARRGGACTSKAMCDAKGDGFVAIPKLCSRKADVDCVCCARAIVIPQAVGSPCVKTETCSSLNGSCMDRKECRKRGKELGQRLKWKKKLCKGQKTKLASKRCGCCFA